MRSWLFVPADSKKKLGKIHAQTSDAVVLDLEDSVARANKPLARELAADFLGKHELEHEQLWVRINPLTTPDAAADLEAIVPAAPAGIMLPKARSAQDVNELSLRLGQLEADHGLQSGSIKILPLVTEVPEALFTLGGYVDCDDRLAGLSWGAEDLGSAIGATEVRDGFGGWTPPFEMVRNLCLFAAHAAGVPAIDTIHADFRDIEGLAESCADASRDGFAGKLAIHPGQVEIINNAFKPSAEDIEHAQKVVALFEGNPESGVLELDGVMLDRPHLLKAKRILKNL